MTEQQEFATYVVDLLEPFGPATAKRMFGGFGIFHQGLMIGLIADGSLYLKSDAQSQPEYEELGAVKFSYTKKNKEYFLSYYQAPESFFEDPDDTVSWARLAYDAALRSASRKASPGKSRPANN